MHTPRAQGGKAYVKEYWQGKSRPIIVFSHEELRQSHILHYVNYVYTWLEY